jgi:hypothetical protein
MWVSDITNSCPEAEQVPVHPAPSGRREGCGHEPSFMISRGTKKGQAKVDPSEKAHCNAGRDINGEQLLALSYWLLAFSFF